MSETFIEIDLTQQLDILRQTYPTNLSCQKSALQY